MELIDRAIEGKYWVVYYLVYAAGVATGLALYWPEITGFDTPKDTRLFLLAGIVGLAAGTALLSVIIVEVTGRMVLLIPAAWRKAKSEGHAEGRVEGRAEGLIEGHAEGRVEGRVEGLAEGLVEGHAEGRAAEHDRIQSVIAQFGQVDPDTGAITLGTEAQEQLRNGHGKP